MTAMKSAWLVPVALLLAACATAPSSAPSISTPSASKPAAGSDTEMASQISRICALPDSQRDQEIEKLKTQSGMVLYCGRSGK